MKSPFPGMDPYLEQSWRDVHHRLITYACDDLQTRLPRDLRARVEERVAVEPAPGYGDMREISPDIRVIERGRGERAAPEQGEVAVAEPLVVPIDEPMTEGFIEIIDVGSGRRVVTVIEVLVITNKWPGEDQDKYLQKQRELREGGISLVEIDLLRDGKRRLAVPLRKLPVSHRTTYQICVSRGWKPTQVEVYRAPLRERLPVIRVPLRETDADVPLDLQKLIDQCYVNGGYDDIDYKVDPVPALDPEDAAWAEALLRGRGLR